MYPAFTHSVHPKYIQNFPCQFPCSFPSPENDQYIHSVPGHVTAMFPVEEIDGDILNFPKKVTAVSLSGSFRKSLWFPQRCDCSDPGHVTMMSHWEIDGNILNFPKEGNCDVPEWLIQGFFFSFLSGVTMVS